MAPTAPRARLRQGVLACALVAAACAGAGLREVENPHFGVSFRIDDDWALYDEHEYLAATDADLEPAQRRRRLSTTWIRAFDASEEPSPANVLRDDTSAPHGLARIDLLSEREREAVNLVSLRSAHLGFDPVERQRQRSDGRVEIRRQEELSLEGGQHGIRMVVAYDTAGGGVAVVDQTALLDGANSVRYLLVVGCSEQCYRDNEEAIERVVGSWRIQKR